MADLAAEPQIQKIEKRVLQLVLLAVVVILYLTLSLIYPQVFKAMDNGGFDVFSADHFKFFIFLATLILLFCAYMIVHHRRLARLTRDLVQQKESGLRLSQDLKTLSALFDVSYRINSQDRLFDILNTVTREMLACFHADHSSIMMLDKRSQTLKTMVSTGEKAELAKDALVPIGHSIAGQVVKSGEPLLLQGKVNPADFPGLQVKQKKISSALCVPLKIGSRCIGVLNVNLLDSSRFFSESDLRLISIFANNAAVAINNALLMREKVKRLQIQTVAERLHPPAVIREMVKALANDGKAPHPREKVRISILFADIRGFSSMVNEAALEDVIDFLDDFYSAMNEAVAKHHGNTDKFIGDEVMAFFGAPNSLANSAESCTKAAIEMIHSFEQLQEKFSEKSPFFKDMGIGIGLNTGEAYFGHIGSESRSDYTVIGKSVNLARRLCEHAESGQILTTTDTVLMLDAQMNSERLGAMALKGIAGEVEVYRIR
ncbi:MAG: GAF domain-containing protein [Desulfobacterales bacterium]|nr:GAF domain-containing protein [Desulfobacterales bacterium]